MNVHIKVTLASEDERYAWNFRYSSPVWRAWTNPNVSTNSSWISKHPKLIELLNTFSNVFFHLTFCELKLILKELAI